ncbi:MAG: hypothetical protein AAF517_28605, partial [Planctomycetota bacterium]
VAATIAATAPDLPVLVDAFLERSELKIHVNVLNEAETVPLPRLSVEDAAVSRYLDAIKSFLSRQHDTLMESAPPQLSEGELTPQESRYFEARRHLEVLEKKLRDLESRLEEETHLRVNASRRARYFVVGNDYRTKNPLRNLAKAREIQEFLDELARRAEPVSDDLEVELLELIVRAKRAAVAVGGVTDPSCSRCLLIVRSAGTGADFVDFGEPRDSSHSEFGWKEGLALAADSPEETLHVEEVRDSSFSALLIEGAGATTLAALEQGTILCVKDHSGIELRFVDLVPLSEADDVLSVLEECRRSREAWESELGRGEATPADDPLPVREVHRLFSKSRRFDLRTGLVLDSLNPLEHLYPLLPTPVEIADALAQEED